MGKDVAGGKEDPYPALAPVTALPKGQSVGGVYQLAGNVSEWVADPWQLYSDQPPYRRPDPNPARAGAPVFRGGGFVDGFGWCNTFARRPASLDAVYDPEVAVSDPRELVRADIGFRVALSAAEGE